MIRQISICKGAKLSQKAQPLFRFYASPEQQDPRRVVNPDQEEDVFAGPLRCSPTIEPRLDAHKINISALDISPDQLYAQLVSNICSLLPLCQQSFYRGLQYTNKCST
jgi:hypothetical protein